MRVSRKTWMIWLAISKFSSNRSIRAPPHSIGSSRVGDSNSFSSWARSAYPKPRSNSAKLSHKTVRYEHWKSLCPKKRLNCSPRWSQPSNSMCLLIRISNWRYRQFCMRLWKRLLSRLSLKLSTQDLSNYTHCRVLPRFSVLLNSKVCRLAK